MILLDIFAATLHVRAHATSASSASSGSGTSCESSGTVISDAPKPDIPNTTEAIDITTMQAASTGRLTGKAPAHPGRPSSGGSAVSIRARQSWEGFGRHRA